MSEGMVAKSNSNHLAELQAIFDDLKKHQGSPHSLSVGRNLYHENEYCQHLKKILEIYKGHTDDRDVALMLRNNLSLVGGVLAGGAVHRAVYAERDFLVNMCDIAYSSGTSAENKFLVAYGIGTNRLGVGIDPLKKLIASKNAKAEALSPFDPIDLGVRAGVQSKGWYIYNADKCPATDYWKLYEFAKSMPEVPKEAVETFKNRAIDNSLAQTDDLNLYNKLAYDKLNSVKNDPLETFATFKPRTGCDKDMEESSERFGKKLCYELEKRMAQSKPGDAYSPEAVGERMGKEYRDRKFAAKGNYAFKDYKLQLEFIKKHSSDRAFVTAFNKAVNPDKALKIERIEKLRGLASSCANVAKTVGSEINTRSANIVRKIKSTIASHM